VKRIKKAIRGKKSYSRYTEHRLMAEFSIGYKDLMDFPFERYLEHAKILNLEKKEEKKEKKRAERKAESKT
jgi:hypothetical protein